MGVIQTIGRHAQKPRGLLGRLLANFMTRTTLPISRWTAEVLQVKPADQLVEVGFGNGASIQHFATVAREGRVVGVEVSDTMIAVATKRNAAAIAAGRVQLRQSDGRTLPLPDAAFDKACTINTVYVLPRPLDIFREMHRVLKPGGAIAVAFPFRETFREFPLARRTPGFHFHELSAIQSDLSQAGFVEPREHRNEHVKFGCHCLIAAKPRS